MELAPPTGGLEESEISFESDPRDDEICPHPADVLIEIPLGQGTVTIGCALPDDLKDALIKLIQNNVDAFAWSPSEMPGISPEIIVYKLSVDPGAKHVKRKRRPLDGERLKTVKIETDKLLKADFVREIRFQSWVANAVLVPKSNEKWRMYIDFADLNKACPKDVYPLPRIDQLVDSTNGHKYLTFIDAYPEYNQIRMKEEEDEHTTFFNDNGILCCKVMPFGLKNAGAT